MPDYSNIREQLEGKTTTEQLIIIGMQLDKLGGEIAAKDGDIKRVFNRVFGNGVKGLDTQITELTVQMTALLSQMSAAVTELHCATSAINNLRAEGCARGRTNAEAIGRVERDTERQWDAISKLSEGRAQPAAAVAQPAQVKVDGVLAVVDKYPKLAMVAVAIFVLGATSLKDIVVTNMKSDQIREIVHEVMLEALDSRPDGSKSADLTAKAKP